MSTSNRIDIGDRVRLEATFLDIDEEAEDPTEVTLTVRKPSGTVITPSVTSVGTGEYVADVDIDVSGLWRYRWAGTGALVAAEEGEFSVDRRRVP